MIRRPPRSTLSSSSAASDVYKRQEQQAATVDAMSTEQRTAALDAMPGEQQDALLKALLQELDTDPRDEDAHALFQEHHHKALGAQENTAQEQAQALDAMPAEERAVVLDQMTEEEQSALMDVMQALDEADIDLSGTQGTNVLAGLSSEEQAVALDAMSAEERAVVLDRMPAERQAALLDAMAELDEFAAETIEDWSDDDEFAAEPIDNAMEDSEFAATPIDEAAPWEFECMSAEDQVKVLGSMVAEERAIMLDAMPAEQQSALHAALSAQVELTDAERDAAWGSLTAGEQADVLDTMTTQERAAALEAMTLEQHVVLQFGGLSMSENVAGSSVVEEPLEKHIASPSRSDVVEGLEVSPATLDAMSAEERAAVLDRMPAERQAALLAELAEEEEEEDEFAATPIDEAAPWDFGHMSVEDQVEILGSMTAEERAVMLDAMPAEQQSALHAALSAQVELTDAERDAAWGSLTAGEQADVLDTMTTQERAAALEAMALKHDKPPLAATPSAKDRIRRSMEGERPSLVELGADTAVLERRLSMSMEDLGLNLLEEALDEHKAAKEASITTVESVQAPPAEKPQESPWRRLLQEDATEDPSIEEMMDRLYRLNNMLLETPRSRRRGSMKLRISEIESQIDEMASARSSAESVDTDNTESSNGENHSLRPSTAPQPFPQRPLIPKLDFSALTQPGPSRDTPEQEAPKKPLIPKLNLSALAGLSGDTQGDARKPFKQPAIPRLALEKLGSSGEQPSERPRCVFGQGDDAGTGQDTSETTDFSLSESSCATSPRLEWTPRASARNNTRKNRQSKSPEQQQQEGGWNPGWLKSQMANRKKPARKKAAAPGSQLMVGPEVVTTPRYAHTCSNPVALTTPRNEYQNDTVAIDMPLSIDEVIGSDPSEVQKKTNWLKSQLAKRRQMLLAKAKAIDALSTSPKSPRVDSSIASLNRLAESSSALRHGMQTPRNGTSTMVERTIEKLSSIEPDLDTNSAHSDVLAEYDRQVGEITMEFYPNELCNLVQQHTNSLMSQSESAPQAGQALGFEVSGGAFPFHFEREGSGSAEEDHKKFGDRVDLEEMLGPRTEHRQRRRDHHHEVSLNVIEELFEEQL
eukprot:TRINITY_DN2693_c0_g1_i5.p1 TRINITY_DN2693_c0_g1~~TRINITY_DN2693_c0_g1_i5.p1  ORF type:complete len:1102 (+),score=277.71 TRINITY_DN2693_c0_g1_i5:124-3429(+)